jgi:hypothetical protein
MALESGIVFPSGRARRSPWLLALDWNLPFLRLTISCDGKNKKKCRKGKMRVAGSAEWGQYETLNIMLICNLRRRQSMRRQQRQPKRNWTAKPQKG